MRSPPRFRLRVHYLAGVGQWDRRGIESFAFVGKDDTVVHGSPSVEMQYVRQVSDFEDEDEDFTPWTTDGADRLRLAAAEAATALQRHAETVGKLTSKSRPLDLIEASNLLLPALLEVANAQFEFTGNSGPLGLLFNLVDDDDDDEEEEEDEDEQVATTGLSILQRRDYRVLDEASVITQGRDAYRRVWPDDTQTDATEDVTSLGGALYQLAHDAGTWDVLERVDGLRPAGGSLVVVAHDETLGPDPDEWPDELFDHDQDDVIYRQLDAFS